MIAPTLRDNQVALRQGIELLSALSVQRYTQRAAACFNSSAGGHFRHVIEHYMSFLSASETGEIDYEARARDPLIENDPSYAIAQLESISDRLGCLSEDQNLRVKSESSSAGGSSVWCRSSTLRELEFLLSHTVHHYALIGVVCQLAGQSLPKEFGIAPSTLRHLRAQQIDSCAR